MSASLKWRPLPKEIKGHDIGNLKFIIRDKFGVDNDSFPVTVGRSFLPFLEGVKAATPSTEVRSDTDSLIAAIEAHGEVELLMVY